MQVYLVEDAQYSPGRIYAVFASDSDAQDFHELLRGAGILTEVVPRTLHFGQPPRRGYNH